jgi:hypothetical protein
MTDNYNSTDLSIEELSLCAKRMLISFAIDMAFARIMISWTMAILKSALGI